MFFPDKTHKRRENRRTLGIRPWLFEAEDVEVTAGVDQMKGIGVRTGWKKRQKEVGAVNSFLDFPASGVAGGDALSVKPGDEGFCEVGRSCSVREVTLWWT
jgi:hypothetical protein